MAAYAALVSVMHTIEQMERHPRPPISLDKTQFESLTQNITYLQEFLECFPLHADYSDEADPLEMRIAYAAYAAENVIESFVADRILAASTSPGKEFSSAEEIDSGEEIDFGEEISYSPETSSDERISVSDLFQDLQKVMDEFEGIRKVVVEIKERMGVQDQPQRNSGSLRSSSSSTGQSGMVGFDEVLLEVMKKLTGGRRGREVIPIDGMPGIGKTTLARNIYHHQGIREHFTIISWATVSQKYIMEEIIFQLLQEDEERMSQKKEFNEMGQKLYQKLSGRRYLIIMDDIWDIRVWHQLKFFFPNNDNGSRIVITTRHSNLAFDVAGSDGINMALLDEDSSWKLFSRIVFGDEHCPPELEEIGTMIVESCGGLPLSIVVVGGLLAKSEQTREYWEYIAENVNSIVNSEDDNKCLQLLHMSYSELPVYLKPCFLYMGVFSTYWEILVSKLVELWVAEGCLKPISGKSLEDVAHEYLKELINRNLVSVLQLGSVGNIKYCNIHDLLRDLCLREAQKEMFFNVITQNNLTVPEDLSTQRRIVISDTTPRRKVLNALQFMALARSLICDSVKILPLRDFRLLRIMSCPQFDYSDSLKDLFRLVNLRYLLLNAPWVTKLPSSVHLLWNLHTLIVHIGEETGPFEIWNMSQLRRLEFGKGVYLDPPSDDNIVILENLQTLGMIMNFVWCEQAIKRIPNIKKLKVDYYEHEGGSSNYFLNNFERLDKLESLNWQQPCPRASDIMNDLTLPHSLKKLTIDVWYVHWEDMLEKTGLLPSLEKLKLVGGSFEGREWETVEDRFPCLRFLQMERCGNLECWITESSHFPSLEHLVLVRLEELNEIPLEIGEISSLKLIKLVRCSESAVISAKEIIEEQKEYNGEVSLQVRVSTWNSEQRREFQRLECSNFKLT